MDSLNLEDLGDCISALLSGDPDFDKEQASYGGDCVRTLRDKSGDSLYEVQAGEELVIVNSSALARMLGEWFTFTPKENPRWNTYIQEQADYFGLSLEANDSKRGGMSNYEAVELTDKQVLEQINRRPSLSGLDKITRVTVVSDEKVEFEKYDLYEQGVELHLQDDGKTLKIFPRKD